MPTIHINLQLQCDKLYYMLGSNIFQDQVPKPLENGALLIIILFFNQTIVYVISSSYK